MAVSTLEMPEKPSRSNWDDDGFRNAVLYKMLPPVLFVEQPRQVHHGVVVDGNHEVRVLGVVDPRHMLVADALDAVRAKAVFQQGWTL